MSMTGRWIDALTERAKNSDLDAQMTLRGAGLWRSPEEEAANAEEYFAAEAGNFDVQYLETDEPNGKPMTDDDLPW